MARLPQYAPDQVRQGTVPGVRYNANAPANFDALASGLYRGASEVEHAQFLQRREQGQADETAINGAKASIDLYDGQQQFLLAQAKGKAAIEGSQKYLADRTKALDKIRQTLQPHQRAQFDEAVLGRGVAAQEVAFKSGIKGGNEYTDETYANAGAAFLDRSSKAAASGQVAMQPRAVGMLGPAFALNSAATDDMLAERLSDIDEHYKRNGWRIADPDGARANDIEAEMTAHHVGIIDALEAGGDDVTANAYFEAKKDEISGKQRGKVQAKVTKANNDAAVGQAVGAAMTLNVTPDTFANALPGEVKLSPEEARRNGVETIKASKLSDELEARAVKDFNTAFARARAADAKLKSDNLEALQQRIDNGDADADILRDERMESITPAGQKAVTRELDQRAKAGDSKAQYAEYTRLLKMATTPETKDEFMGLALPELRAGLSSQQYDELKELRKDMSPAASQQKYQGVRTRANAVDGWVDKLYPDATGYYADTEQTAGALDFRKEIDDMLVAEAVARGHTLTPAEIDEVVGPLFSEITLKRYDAGIDWLDADATGKLADIGEYPKNVLIAAYEQAVEDGGELTDERIRAIAKDMMSP